jgi:hypothetical protein
VCVSVFMCVYVVGDMWGSMRVSECVYLYVSVLACVYSCVCLFV